jgi:hypothetical protein
MQRDDYCVLLLIDVASERDGMSRFVFAVVVQRLSRHCPVADDVARDWAVMSVWYATAQSLSKVCRRAIAV